MKRFGLLCLTVFCFSYAPSVRAESLPVITHVAAQPLGAQVIRVVEAMEFLGQPLSDEKNERLRKALNEEDEKKMVTTIQKILDPLTLAYVTINPESRVKAVVGEATPELTQNGWTLFLVKVHNRAGVTAPLQITTGNAAPILRRSTGSSKPNNPLTPQLLRDRWLSIITYDKPPLSPTLSGLPLEYRVALLYSRDAGEREARFGFNVGQGTQTGDPRHTARLRSRWRTDDRPIHNPRLRRPRLPFPFKANGPRLLFSRPGLSSRWRNGPAATRKI